MAKLALCMLLLVCVGGLIAVTPRSAAAQEYKMVAGLQPWSAETNFMSLPGYLRWMTWRDTGVWLSMPEADRIVREQAEQARK
jgi:hypothetical protein